MTFNKQSSRPDHSSVYTDTNFNMVGMNPYYSELEVNIKFKNRIFYIVKKRVKKIHCT